MKRTRWTMVLTMLMAGSANVLASPIWQKLPVLGTDSAYTGSLVIYTDTGPVVIPYDRGDGIVTTGSSMSIFEVGESVHGGSGVYVDPGETYIWTAVFTGPTRTLCYSGSFVGPSDGFWMTWNTPSGGDGNGVSTLTDTDAGPWTYTETYTNAENASLTSVTAFTVTPEPTTVLSIMISWIFMFWPKRK